MTLKTPASKGLLAFRAFCCSLPEFGLGHAFRIVFALIFVNQTSAEWQVLLAERTLFHAFHKVDDRAERCMGED